ncbi:MAG: hypothetical protein ACOZF0_05670 [Thermodesulfobacteriota bacterium]
MTESWRLAAGDHFLKDADIGLLRLYTLVNSQIFRLFPDITLLGFRRLQYGFTIAALLVFSIALFRVEKKAWFLGYVFSIFAFTGLDPVGSTSNLNYYTYPHFFLILYISFFLFGITANSPVSKKVFYLLSGFCLWCISICLLHLSVIIVAPLLLFFLLKRIKPDQLVFPFRDVLLVMSPFCICWLVFLSYFNVAYIKALFKTVIFFRSIPFYSDSGLITINPGIVSHVLVAGAILVLIRLSLHLYRFHWIYGFSCLVFISILSYLIMETSFFGILRPCWIDSYRRPGWFASYLAAFYLIVGLGWGIRIFHGKFPSEKLPFVLIVLPCMVLSLSMVVFSGLGMLTLMHCAIPAMAAVTLFLTHHQFFKTKSIAIQIFSIIICFGPFYYEIGWSDWRHTYFDVSPEKMDTVIKQGFGAGIKTNSVYSSIYGWVESRTNEFSNPDDFMISTVLNPMAHMIAKRRPALVDSFLNPGSPAFSRAHQSWVERMIRDKREPVLAFVFENTPAFSAQSLSGTGHSFFQGLFAYPQYDSNDYIIDYITKNMEPLETIRISRRYKMIFFINPNKVPANKRKKAIAWLHQMARKTPDSAAYRQMAAKLMNP